MNGTNTPDNINYNRIAAAMDMFNTLVDKTKNWLPHDGTVNYYGKLMTTKEADHYLETLLGTIEWRNDEAIIKDRNGFRTWKPPRDERHNANPLVTPASANETGHPAKSQPDIPDDRGELIIFKCCFQKFRRADF